jgi:signal transduction histidine kinase
VSLPFLVRLPQETNADPSVSQDEENGRGDQSGLAAGEPGGEAGDHPGAEEVDDLPALAAPVEEAAYRIVAESLTNVVRHAGARTCRVRLGWSDGDLCVAAQDDGQGIPELRTDGVGLESMRRRASDIGGRIRVELAPPHGTLVTARLPLGAS